MARFYFGAPWVFWAAVLLAVVLGNQSAFGLTLTEALLVTFALYLAVNVTVLLCGAVFIEEPPTLPSVISRQKGLITIVFLLVCCALPIAGFVVVSVQNPNQIDTAAGRDLLFFGVLPFLIASVATFYAAVEKVVEDAGAKHPEPKASSTRADQFIVDPIRKAFVLLTTLIAVLTIGRTGTSDRMIETSASGIYTMVALTLSFFGFVSIYYWAAPVSVVSSVYEDHSTWDMVVFTFDNMLKALIGDFPELAGFSMNEVRHNSDNPLITLAIGVYRLLLPLSILLILVGSPRGRAD